MEHTKQLNTENQNFYSVNRKHKDSLFCLMFQEKSDLLELYNAINGTEYQDPELLTVYTLEDAVYMGVKNDISFLVSEMLSLYEHQSTKNPNMPMRGLIYLARNYESYIEQNNLDIYSSVLQKFPLPQYYVFYNGTAKEPDQKVLQLIDAFPKIEGKEPCLNCTATLLNINYGRNARLMEKSKKLKEYAIFIHRIRENQAEGMNLKTAVDTAIDQCIKDDVLREFLVKCRGEVRNMVLSSFDQENHDRIMKEEYIRQGREVGIEEGRCEKLKEQIQKKLSKNQSIEDIAEDLIEDVEVIRELVRKLEKV